MADCDRLFKLFDDKISFSSEERDTLCAARDDIRAKIEKYFADIEEVQRVEFHGQGSFMMRTIIKREHEEHDVDDGIYFEYDDETTDHETKKYHQWVAEAVDKQTSITPEDHNACVRVHYKDGHHVDLAIYRVLKDDVPELAHTKDGWTKSDARSFFEWFNSKTSDTEMQLRRTVKYAKAWLDNKQLPVKGVIMTILVAENYLKNDRDDLCFLDTMKAIRRTLLGNFSCYRPTEPKSEDLLAAIKDTNDETTFMDALDGLIQSGDQAIATDVEKEACKRWTLHLGKRFSCETASDTLKEAIVTSTSHYHKHDQRSA